MAPRYSIVRLPEDMKILNNNISPKEKCFTCALRVFMLEMKDGAYEPIAAEDILK